MTGILRWIKKLDKENNSSAMKVESTKDMDNQGNNTNPEEANTSTEQANAFLEQTTEEFDRDCEELNSQLDQLNSLLDAMEQKNDEIQEQLLQLLQCNRETRKLFELSRNSQPSA
ncbi:UPF0184 protein AAEL002161 [Schistocerca serialis cubense]|uniref:UPF0184 protein AAEL002161 n=2 Tax=Schistocerca TaxID=7008 RepID=UPI00214E260B|nr:UPF0184 protein AAEL002161 [Schistocerca serialis cubense]